MWERQKSFYWKIGLLSFYITAGFFALKFFALKVGCNHIYVSQIYGKLIHCVFVSFFFMLYYTTIKTSYTRALLVLDTTGTLVYASLGADERSLILAMKKDFIMYNKKEKLGPVQHLTEPKSNDKMVSTIESYRSIVENPSTSPSELNMKYRLIGGTPLQYKVWDYLLNETKPLATTTYGAIAKYFEMSTFLSRAIGNACGANRIAIVIPCHRVLGHKGDITGYKWGTDIKRELLRREKTA